MTAPDSERHAQIQASQRTLFCLSTTNKFPMPGVIG